MHELPRQPVAAGSRPPAGACPQERVEALLAVLLVSAATLGDPVGVEHQGLARSQVDRKSWNVASGKMPTRSPGVP